MVIRKFDEKRYRLIALVVSLCLLSLMLDTWQQAAQRRGRHTWLDNTVCASASPLEGLLAQGARWGEQNYAALVTRRQWREENAALRARVADLQGQLLSAQEAAAQNQRREDLRVEFASMHPRPASVIGWGQDGWKSFLVLDQGSLQGAAARDVVVAHGGVVGQAYAVTADSARVLPLTDPASQIAAQLSRSRERGVLRGISADRCELEYLDRNADVRVGDLVTTSGMGGIFPKGLTLGAVVSVHHRQETAGVAVEVRPAVELRTVEEAVLIRTGGR